MTWQDLVNAGFEFGAGFAVLAHCVQLYRDKIVRGVSVGATAFFFSWGLWNLYFYPHLNQWASFVGGLLITFSNLLWVTMLVYYKTKEARKPLITDWMSAFK